MSAQESFFSVKLKLTESSYSHNGHVKFSLLFDACHEVPVTDSGYNFVSF